MTILARALSGLREADWLTRERASAWGLLVALTVGIEAITLVTQLILSANSDAHWRPMTTDFNAFWSGAVLALRGTPSLAYSSAAMTAAQAIGAQPAHGQFLPYLYPPIFMLLSLPLGYLPYLAAMAVFAIGGTAAAMSVLRRVLPPAWPTLAILALPIATLNAGMGQNGFLGAICFGGALLLLDRRPVLAGCCLGMLACKPHLAFAVPFALLAARRWAALAACAGSAAGLAALSWLVLGTASWVAFFAYAPMARAVLNGHEAWDRMVSVYAGVRLLHGGAGLATTAQLVACALAIAIVVRVALRRPGAGPEMAAAAAAAALCSPYLFDYDLLSLSVPMAWLAGCGGAQGWRPWEKIVLLAMYAFPQEARNCNMALGLPLSPFVTAAFFAVIVGRGLAPRYWSIPSPWSPAYPNEQLQG
jgi:hypothetical protein